MRPRSSAARRSQITIRRPTETADGKGGFVTSWTTIASPLAEVEGLDGRESVMDRVLEGVSVYRLWIRWQRGLEVRANDQVLLGDRELNVKAPAADPDGRRRDLVFVADTTARRGT